MNYCTNCGNKLEEGSNFCGSCGAHINNGLLSQQEENIAIENTPKQKKNSKVKILILSIILLLASVIGIIIAMSGNKEKEYNAQIVLAERYVEELDYEQAEAAYLEAIKIDSKQLKAYVALSKVYIKQEKYEEAKDVMDKAEEENAKGDEDTEKEREEVEKIIDESENFIGYKWVIEANMDVDDIFYMEANGLDPEETINENKKHSKTPYAVFKQGDYYGLIDLQGNILVEAEYVNIYMYGDMCMLERKDPIYIPEYQYDCYTFTYVEGELQPVEGLGGPGNGIYYYYNGLQAMYDVFGTLLTTSLPSYAFPVQQADTYYPNDFEQSQTWYDKLQSGKFGVYKENKLVTDFIYDECGSSAEGLLAVCQNGRWGYIDQDGNVVIPLDYDASWDKYDIEYDADGYFYHEFCYAASDGYVTLCREEKWELRDIEGNIVIPSGVFDEILPVYKNRAFVRVADKWGIIELVNEKTEEYNIQINEMSQSEFDITMSDIQFWCESVGEELWNEKGKGEMISEAEGDLIPYYDTVGNLYAAKFYPSKKAFPEINNIENIMVTYYYTTTSETTTGLVPNLFYTVVYFDYENNPDFSDRFISDKGYLLRYISNDGENYDIMNAEIMLDKLPAETAFYEFGLELAARFPLVVSQNSEESGVFSSKQIEEIRAALGAPKDAKYTISEEYYWDAGERWLVYIEFTQNGALVACADVDADTGELVRNIMVY